MSKIHIFSYALVGFIFKVKLWQNCLWSIACKVLYIQLHLCRLS